MSAGAVATSRQPPFLLQLQLPTVMLCHCHPLLLLQLPGGRSRLHPRASSAPALVAAPGTRPVLEGLTMLLLVGAAAAAPPPPPACLVSGRLAPHRRRPVVLRHRQWQLKFHLSIDMPAPGTRQDSAALAPLSKPQRQLGRAMLRTVSAPASGSARCARRDRRLRSCLSQWKQRTHMAAALI
jgi:hypothetical protein